MTDYTRPDHYSRKAHTDGLPARSAYKLEELARKHRLVHRNARYLDLGCRPGSWSAWLARQTGGTSTFLGVDLEPCDGYPGVFLQCSIEDLTDDVVRAQLGGAPKVVLSDMAPSTTGTRDVDHLRQIALAEAALAVALRVLEPGGLFVCKVFDGRDAPAFVTSMRPHFKKIRRHKPKATRSSSREFYMVGDGFIRARRDDPDSEELTGPVDGGLGQDPAHQ